MSEVPSTSFTAEERIQRYLRSVEAEDGVFQYYKRIGGALEKGIQEGSRRLGYNRACVPEDLYEKMANAASLRVFERQRGIQGVLMVVELETEIRERVEVSRVSFHQSAPPTTLLRFLIFEKDPCCPGIPLSFKKLVRLASLDLKPTYVMQIEDAPNTEF